MTIDSCIIGVSHIFERKELITMHELFEKLAQDFDIASRIRCTTEMGAEYRSRYANVSPEGVTLVFALAVPCGYCHCTHLRVFVTCRDTTVKLAVGCPSCDDIKVTFPIFPNSTRTPKSLYFWFCTKAESILTPENNSAQPNPNRIVKTYDH